MSNDKPIYLTAKDKPTAEALSVVLRSLIADGGSYQNGIPKRDVPQTPIVGKAVATETGIIQEVVVPLKKTGQPSFSFGSDYSEIQAVEQTEGDETTPKNDSVRFWAARCLGTVERNGQTYSPIQATYNEETEIDNPAYDADNNPNVPQKIIKYPGDLKVDENSNPVYLMARWLKPNEQGFVDSFDQLPYKLKWEYVDGTDVDEDIALPASAMINGCTIPNWKETSDEKLAAKNYDLMPGQWVAHGDWLLPGKTCSIVKRTSTFTVPNPKYHTIANPDYNSNDPDSSETIAVGEETVDVSLVYYERSTSETTYVTPFYAQGDIEHYKIEVEDGEIKETLLEERDANSEQTLCVQFDDDVPKVISLDKICNDCTQPYTDAIFVRTDIDGVKFPFVVNCDTLPYLWGIPIKQIACYYQAPNDTCTPKTAQLSYEVKSQDGFLRLVSSTCATYCARLPEVQ
ncbi:hypothetical protein FACS189443_3190 [Planctomycetales bacterium]|nr:hypothetical protein FACS189443_3190 [Planctomycetales bacterium]